MPFEAIIKSQMTFVACYRSFRAKSAFEAGTVIAGTEKRGFATSRLSTLLGKFHLSSSFANSIGSSPLMNFAVMLVSTTSASL